MSADAMRQVGTPCPDCGSIYRRCFCRRCGTRYTTREQLVGKTAAKTRDDDRASRLRRAAILDQIDRIERSLAVLKRNLPPTNQ